MPTIKKFEDLEIWQIAYEYFNWLEEIRNSTGLISDRRLRDQIDGSSGSIMDNIAEGFERQCKKEFIHFLIIAKGSAGEAKSQLYRLKTRSYIDEEQFNANYERLTMLSKKINRFIGYLQKTEVPGWRYR